MKTEHQNEPYSARAQIGNLPELNHDPYLSKTKPQEPTLCPDCNAIFHEGRWQWSMVIPAGAHSSRCPACQRIRDHCPAGILTLTGDFLAQHHDEIVHILHNLEERQKAEHPLKRLIRIDEAGTGSMTVSLTDPHLARAMGQALYDAWRGDLDYHYHQGEYLLRVSWHR